MSNSQFRAVLARRISVRDGLLTICAAENGRGYSRLGVSVGKPCGSAVVRNRLKRLLREAFRLSQDRIPSGFDYVVMPSHSLSNKMRRSEGEGAFGGHTLEQLRASMLALSTNAVEKASKRGPRDGEQGKNA